MAQNILTVVNVVIGVLDSRETVEDKGLSEMLQKALDLEIERRVDVTSKLGELANLSKQ